MSGLRVLVVDGHRGIGKMVKLILQTTAPRVISVACGEECLERLGIEQFDVVLSDLGLGRRMNGLQLCAEVRSAWPRVRFVLVTGSALDPAEARGAGVDALLTKPYRPRDLRLTIASLDPSRVPLVRPASSSALAASDRTLSLVHSGGT